MASAARPLKRKTADQAYTGFMDRVAQVNADPYYLYRATKVVLFGSYLTESETVNDIDLAIAIEPKEADDDRRGKQFDQRINEAVDKGVNFRNVAEYYGWPQYV